MTSYLDILCALPKLTRLEAMTIYDVIKEFHPSIETYSFPPPQTNEEITAEFEARCQERLLAALDHSAQKRRSPPPSDEPKPRGKRKKS
jgi:hypothetical protein